MKLRDCIASAAFIINLVEEYDALCLGGDIEKPFVRRNIEFLMSCANRVISEIADNYIVLRNRQLIETDADGFVSYDKFDMPPSHFLFASKDDKRIGFKEFPDKIETGVRGSVLFEYSFLPHPCEIDDELPFRDGMPDERIIAYGVAAEYYLINGQPDEAIVWDKRYRDGLHSCQLKRRELRLKRRLWV